MQRSNERVALKVLNASPGAQPEFRLRFLRETYALSSVNHPNIVTVRDFGAREGRYYYAMDYVEGPTLRQRVLLQGPGAPDDVLALLESMTDALNCLAEAGLTRRRVLSRCTARGSPLLLVQAAAPGYYMVHARRPVGGVPK